MPTKGDKWLGKSIETLDRQEKFRQWKEFEKVEARKNEYDECNSCIVF